MASLRRAIAIDPSKALRLCFGEGSKRRCDLGMIGRIAPSDAVRLPRIARMGSGLRDVWINLILLAPADRARVRRLLQERTVAG